MFKLRENSQKRKEAREKMQKAQEFSEKKLKMLIIENLKFYNNNKKLCEIQNFLARGHYLKGIFNKWRQGVYKKIIVREQNQLAIRHYVFRVSERAQE